MTYDKNAFEQWAEKHINERAQIRQEILQDLRAGGWRIVKTEPCSYCRFLIPNETTFHIKDEL